MNVREVILEIKKYKSKDQMVCVFIDFKSAYKTILKDKLFKILEDKNIYSKEEINFLRILY